MNTPDTTTPSTSAEATADKSTPETTPSSHEATKGKKNVLRIREIVALHEWVTDHAADCRITPDTKLANIAQAELEFTVTAANIAGMRAEIGIKKAEKEAPVPIEERLGDLEKWRSGEATDRLSILAEQQCRSREELSELRGLWQLQQATQALLLQRVKDLELHCFGEPPVKDHPELGLDAADRIDGTDNGAKGAE